ncbi:Uncharacterized protein ALO70_01977 [Pseudomonas amygdali pv. eriobotryae]|uniref:Uncharacterized protein n=1 Tax=Pseudomonas amygdali pv. eriobotryae TaxID=129137 RepID=A0A0P9R553_PSEA0|nr:hypothetical protein [Pseudomonas amygdali]KPX23302.1 Uncharacterized protein ALO70_01977 [Pseudomonas amygdali pv. eriobotryae]RML98507.1 hypothetical protein ALQ86_00049 [Pseudomonas amygdali pv. eriobotryae]RMO56797.1 hypothetical protein ALQ39_00574 [Pseudomonas amygdali pv. eriobotryae]GFZ71553.1 hypothetical protein PSE10C_22950 [Pseudomonas amygdali pv. eriobotryae]
MHVPIYPEDLLPQGAFRKLSKSIQNRWPGKSTIKLSSASEILSKALGYADYHALRNASVECPPDAGTPTETTVRQSISAAIQKALTLANDNSVPSEVLGRYVETLPLNALRAFKAATPQGAPTNPTSNSDEVGTVRSRKRQMKQPDSNPTSHAQRLAFVAQLPSSASRPEVEHLQKSGRPPLTANDRTLRAAQCRTH